jgi:hypothetical protein
VQILISLPVKKLNHRLKSTKIPKVALCGFFLSGVVLMGSIGCIAQRPKPNTAAPQRLFSTEGATLDKIPLEQGNVVYLQTIDLHKMEIDQMVGDVERKGIKGLYYPSKTNDSSPFFKRLTVSAVRAFYQTQHPSGMISIINASFFEDYKSSTRLSFPIKLNGTLITAGSSPYGPIQKPADPYYQTIQLRALTWDNAKATISNYNPISGYPLNQASIKNGLVSYVYQDHPAYALTGDPVNRYHVLGVLHPDDVGKANRLLIATSNRATLKRAAEILRQKGVKGDIMTIDGGISTYLWNIKAGDLILPQVAKGEKVPSLPHYLGIRSRSK